VGPGYYKIRFALQENGLQSFRKRLIEKLAIENRFHLRISPNHRVTDYDEVDVTRDILRPIASRDLDPFRFKKRRHRRINIFIGTGNDETKVADCGCRRPHRHTAHTQKMNPPNWFLHETKLPAITYRLTFKYQGHDLRKRMVILFGKGLESRSRRKFAGLSYVVDNRLFTASGGDRTHNLQLRRLKLSLGKKAISRTFHALFSGGGGTGVTETPSISPFFTSSIDSNVNSPCSI
jgi:hypothetical protein